jgi:hypothetical protein
MIEFDLDNFPPGFCAPSDRDRTARSSRSSRADSESETPRRTVSKGASKGVGSLLTSHGDTHKGMLTVQQAAFSYRCVFVVSLVTQRTN